MGTVHDDGRLHDVFAVLEGNLLNRHFLSEKCV